MNAAKRSRDSAMDIVRCVALLSVIGVHFFLNSGFYDEIVRGEHMYIMTVARSACMICVPLFMVLSGYLMRMRRPSLRYYKKITKTLGIYVLASVVCQAYKWVAYDQLVSLRDLIVDTLEFRAANYCWYVEMYIGLFLLIPYLNILYNNIQTKKEKQGLLLVMIVLTCLPAVANTYSFYDINWWINPSSSPYY